MPYSKQNRYKNDQNRLKYMEYEHNHDDVDYLYKVESLLKHQDISMREKSLITDKHFELKQSINNQIMNSGWKKLYKFITESVNDERIQEHINESICKFNQPRNSKQHM